MSVDFLLAGSTPIDLPRCGSEAIGSRRGGDLKMTGKEASGKGTGSFDAALQSARTRPDTNTGPAGARPAATKEADPAAPPVRRRAGQTESEPPAADDETIPAARVSSGPDADSDLDAPSTDLGETIPAVALELTSATGNVMARPVTGDLTADAGQSADTFPADAAEPMPDLPAGREPAAPNQTLAQSGPGSSAPAPVTGEAKASQSPDGGQILTSAPAATILPPAAEISAAGGLIDSPTTGATVATDPMRPEKIDRPDLFDHRADRLPESGQAAEPAASDRGGLPTAARSGDFSTLVTSSAAGDDGSQPFENGADGDADPYHNPSQASGKEAAKTPWFTSVSHAAADYHESTGAGIAGSGSDVDKATEQLLSPQRAVYGDATAPAADAETGEVHHSRDLRAETLAQIVDKAVFRLRDGQSQVRIDLKPESLGHVRLDIATENHQVTLRITAESHVAKDLIDSGISQLKADLQAQGLKVDELEVSVAAEFSDFNRHQAFSGRGSRGRRLPSGDHAGLQAAAAVTGSASAQPGRTAAGIDCFI